MPTHDEFIDRRELRRRLDITERTVTRWIAAGILQPYRRPVGHKTFFRVSDVDALMTPSKVVE